MTNAEPSAALRDEFEAWARHDGLETGRLPDGRYAAMGTDWRWEIWQLGYRAGAARVGIAQDKLDAERYRWLRNESPELQTFWMRAAQSGDMVLETLDAAIDAAREQPPQRDTCAHEWVSANNKVVSGGDICTKCYALRATPSLHSASASTDEAARNATPEKSR